MQDITQVPTSSVGNGQNGGQGHHKLSMDQRVQLQVHEEMRKISAANRLQGAYNASIEGRFGAYGKQIREKISAIKDCAVLEEYAKAGKLNEAGVKKLSSLRKIAEAAEESLVNEGAAGNMATDELAGLLYDVAEENPEAAAALIEAETGVDVDPAEFEEAADGVAESEFREAVGAEETKESRAKTSSVAVGLRSSVSPLASLLIVRRGLVKASQGVRYLQLAQQQQARQHQARGRY